MYREVAEALEVRKLAHVVDLVLADVELAQVLALREEGQAADFVLGDHAGLEVWAFLRTGGTAWG